MTTHSNEIVAGHIWTQPEFPNCTRFVILVPGGDERPFALASNPCEEGGGMVCSEKDGRWRYSADEVAEHFAKLKYRDMGTLYNLIMYDNSLS